MKFLGDWMSLSSGGILGFFLGILLIYFVEPQTGGGVGLLLLVPVFVGIILERIVRALFR